MGYHSLLRDTLSLLCFQNTTPLGFPLHPQFPLLSPPLLSEPYTWTALGLGPLVSASSPSLIYLVIHVSPLWAQLNRLDLGKSQICISSQTCLWSCAYNCLLNTSWFLSQTHPYAQLLIWGDSCSIFQTAQVERSSFSIPPRKSHLYSSSNYIQIPITSHNCFHYCLIQVTMAGSPLDAPESTQLPRWSVNSKSDLLVSTLTPPSREILLAFWKLSISLCKPLRTLARLEILAMEWAWGKCHHYHWILCSQPAWGSLFYTRGSS